MKIKKILIIGLGSIGQRHLENIKKNKNIRYIKIGTVTTGKGNKNIPINLKKNLLIFNSYNEALKWKPTHLIISNPTSLHKKILTKFANNKIKIFIEKPIFDKFYDLKKININYKNIFVGYNLRFSLFFNFIKEVISKKTFGKALVSRFEVGNYLPNWHTYENYIKSYASNKKLGGGAYLTLSHEIDLAQFLFGKIDKRFILKEKVSNLKIDVDDTATILLKSKLCKVINIECNFLFSYLIRRGWIQFSKGLLEYDYF